MVDYGWRQRRRILPFLFKLLQVWYVWSRGNVDGALSMPHEACAAEDGAVELGDAVEAVRDVERLQ